MPTVAAALSPTARAALVARIEADPAAHTLQARLRQSELPVWQAGALEPRNASVRVFAISDGQGGWQVVPGRPDPGGHRGASLPTDPDPGISMQRGSASADTWVLTDGAVDPTTLLPQPLGVADLGALAPQRHQPFGREPLLAGPLHRAGRKHRPPGAPDAGITDQLGAGRRLGTGAGGVEPAGAAPRPGRSRRALAGAVAAGVRALADAHAGRLGRLQPGLQPLGPARLRRGAARAAFAGALEADQPGRHPPARATGQGRGQRRGRATERRAGRTRPGDHRPGRHHRRPEPTA